MSTIDFSRMNEEDFAVQFGMLLKRIHADPINNFVKNPLFMDFTPTIAQSVALKCVFGQQLDPIKKYPINMETKSDDGVFALHEIYLTEVELYEFMTDSNYLPEYQTQRNRINLIVGRRGGKTTISAMLAIFCAIKINWKPFLKKTPAATVAVLSHSVEFSEEILELIKQFIEDSPVLSRLIDKSKKHTQTTFNLKVPFVELVDGKKKIIYSRVSIKVGAASKKTTRGKAICALLCDEIAYWNLDENAAQRDEDILRAVRPSLLQFGDQGLLIKLSSPGIKQGVLYDEYQKRNELPPNFLTLKAPSWVWNNILLAKEFVNEYALDPSGFDCEYRANFIDSISNFILPEFVDRCTQRGVKFLVPETSSDIVYTAALDAAFKGDRFGFTLMGWDGHRLKQYVMQTWQGTRNQPVQATEVAKHIRNVMRDYKIARVHADQYAFQPLREIFDQHGITLEETTFTNTFKKKIYFNLKKHVHNLTIDLLDHPILTTEIKQLQVEQTTTGTIRIGHPPGGHDDCADCTAIAAYILAEKANALGIASGEIAGESDMENGVRTDITGRAFDAPTSRMVADVMGTDFVDNLNDYQFNPETMKWEKKSNNQDDDDDGNDGGSEVIFT